MAVDEAMLLSAEAMGHPTLRFYRWQEPTLSLGYFQRVGDIPKTLLGLSLVRRLSGGGAIVHDQELTYSLIVPPGKWPRRVLAHLVRDVHAAIRRAVPSLQPALVDRTPTPEPFLCFERRSRHDLVLRDSKIVGSAQRNRRGAVLQHGSLLETRSPAARHLLGLTDLANETLREQQTSAILAALGEEWGWKFLPGPLSEDERRLATELERDKYRAAEWNQRR